MTSVSLDNISALLDIIKPDIADQLISDANFCLQDKASAEQWIGNLSANSYANNAIELYRVLPLAAKLDIDPNTKMEILDSLTPIVIRSTECLLQSQPNEDTAKAISLGQALIRQVYEGNKLVIYQLGNQVNITSQTTISALAKSILNACNVLAKILLNSLSQYLQQPKFFWRELHALHLLAQQLDIADLDMPNPMGINTSIDKVYLKLLLFNCTRPNHFSNYELRFVYTELDFWSSLAELRRGNKGGLFAIDPSSNRGAVYADEIEQRSGNIILDTFNLVKFLNSILDENNDSLFSDRISRRVIKDLVRQWGEKIKRQETHIRDHAEISITRGFTSIICMLSRTDSFENFLLLCGQKPSAPDAGVRGIDRTDDVWGTSFEPIDSHPGDPVIFTPVRNNKTRLRLMRGIRTDISLNGAGIELADNKNELQPGEPIAIRTKGNAKWVAGIIRWKHITPSLNTVCGLQFPARNCTPAAIRCNPREEQTERQFMQAIILSKKKDLSDEVTLLCPPLRYSEGSKIYLLTPKKQTAAILGEELETTEHLSHFKISFC
jgi:hypothetical protein